MKADRNLFAITTVGLVAAQVYVRRSGKGAFGLDYSNACKLFTALTAVSAGLLLYNTLKVAKA